MAEEKYLLQMQDIVKNFPGVKALKGVHLDVMPVEIHALMGDNGAGTSTLMNCLAGVFGQTSGSIIYDGELRERYNTIQALGMGISMIHQELSPVLHRPIMENIWLGREPLNRFGLVDHQKMYDMSVEVLKEIELNEDPRTEMVQLTVAKMQMIEIAKAVSYDSNLIIMDEPTSALTEKEIKQLFIIMRKLKDKGKSIIYISHKLDEVYEITDRITVYRDGTYIGTENTKNLALDKLINMMVGRDVDEMFPKVVCPIGEVKMEVRNLSHYRYFTDVSFTVRRGEILGVAGLIGSGRTEVIETIFGIRKKIGGEILIDGKAVDIASPRDAIGQHMALLTEDRRQTGIFPMLSVRLNMAITNIPHYLNKVGLIRNKKLKDDCDDYVKKIQVKTPSLMQRVENLSGGNQQKVLVARWLMTNPEILFLDEPTRGIDVGAKSEIHRLITRLAGEGKSIVMVSSELPEVMGMSDRIMVMHEGLVTGIVENSKDLTQEELMTYATGKAEGKEN
ncbi:sugar ABC transporter ATP-binding protein [Oceanispirochaeta sp.]|uniref:sugar ABC transporter ATP-binding protein n=1 Tax=Oceanispirochaeta sp. TaxID=2035350 RepID=UPI002607F589|nr:sugar ABC transporter ATP-binding protein [Oceanispirochaeta sp.]MDA3958580.1 sugar ABC transporter ATP-binding protein [Oceanispirochaeta sp.]